MCKHYIRISVITFRAVCMVLTIATPWDIIVLGDGARSCIYLEYPTLKPNFDKFCAK